MLELIRLFPRRPLAVSIAGWTFFFIAQVGALTFATYERYVPSPEQRPFDHLWFVYTELPRALPMAAVYAACMVFVAQVIGRFVATDNRDNLTIARWLELLKENPFRAVVWMGLRLVFLICVVGVVVGPMTPVTPWVSPISAFLAGALLVPLVFSSWFAWVVEGVTSQDGAEARRESTATGTRAVHRPGRRNRRRSRGGNASGS